MERTKYMTQIMNETYAGVAIEAVKNGFDGSWERLIAAKLRKDYIKGISEAECLVHAAGGVSDQKLLQMAHFITNSKIVEHDNNKQ